MAKMHFYFPVRADSVMGTGLKYKCVVKSA